MGVREASAILNGEFITTSEEFHSLDRVSGNMLREADNALEARPRHFLAVLCSQENGLLQDKVARLGQPQGADREYEDGEEGYL